MPATSDLLVRHKHALLVDEIKKNAEYIAGAMILGYKVGKDYKLEHKILENLLEQVNKQFN